MKRLHSWLRYLEMTAIIVGASAALVTMIVAIKACSIYQGANSVAARGQLYSNFEKIADRERDDLEYGLLLLDVPITVPVSDYSKHVLGSITDNIDIISIKSAEELFNIIWGIDFWKTGNKEDLKRLRKIYLHAESYIYHLYNAFDYKKEGIMEEGEWMTWKASLDDMGGNPITFAAMWSAHRRGYFSKEFASELQKKYMNNKILEDRTKIFYKEMLDASWLKAFPSY